MKKRKLLRQKSLQNAQPSNLAARHRNIQHMLSLAVRALNEHRPDETDTLCSKILSLDRDNANALNLKGLAAAQLGDNELAERCIRNALAVKPESPVFNANLGILLATAGKTEKALRHFQLALRQQPDNVEVLYNMIELYEKNNQLPEAIETARKALGLQAESKPLVYQLAKLEYRAGEYNQAKKTISSLLGQDIDKDLEFKALHLFAQILDRLGEYQKAFAAFEQSNALLAQTPLARELEPLRRKTIENVIRLKNSCASEIKQQLPATVGIDEDNPPVFLVGFPRSGTTLAGQVLAAHSKVVTLDECETLEPVINEFSLPERSGHLADLSREEAAVSRERYYQLLESLAGQKRDEVIIVDKSPLYISCLGLIQSLFPDARVIVMHRDPRDACLSCFMQDFALNPAMQNFLTMEDTVSFYNAVMELFQCLKDKLSLQILEVQYESLIGQFREETEKMLSFLGLQWEDRIISFYAQARDRRIQTPSYQQVVKPIYSTSRGRWHNYADRIAPHLDILRPHIERLGYQPPKSSK